MAETPNPNPETPVVPASPLGVDPPAPVTPAKAAETPPTRVETPPAKDKSYTQEQIDEIQRKASNYDLIEKDPELVSKVLDHFKAKTGKIGTSPKASPVEQNNEVVNALNAMNAKLTESSRMIAAQEVKMFKMEHPDMDDVKDDMARLVKQYNMPLDEAYRFSKLAKAQAQKPESKVKPATPTSETNQNAGEVEEPDTTFEEVEKQINDPKATPHLDDAILKAYLAAKKLQVAR